MRNPEWIESCQNLVNRGTTLNELFIHLNLCHDDSVFFTLRLQFCYVLSSIIFLSIVWHIDVCLQISYGTLKDHARP